MIFRNFLFGIPIYHTKVDPNKYDKQSIINKISSNYSIASYRNLHDNESDLHHTYKDENNEKFQNINYEKAGLTPLYDDIFYEFASKCLKTKDGFNYKYTIDNYTATKDFQYMRPHQHLPDADFSAAHYLQFDKGNHTTTSFVNSNDFSSYLRFISKSYYGVCDEQNLDNSYLFQNWKYDVEEDDMIIFPSVIRHEVPRQKKNLDKLRIAVACNLSIHKLNL